MNPVVGIVEDNKKIQDVIERCLNMQNNISCPIAVESVKEMQEYLKEQPVPDIILMDIQRSETPGIKGISLMKGTYIDIDFIMRTVYHDLHKIFNALHVGARGYLLKYISFPKIKDSILKLVEGGAPRSAKIAHKMINHIQENTPEKHIESDLTPEHDIVNGLVDGLRYKMITDGYNSTIDMVRTHIYNFYTKLHVIFKAEVIAKLLKLRYSNTLRMNI